MSSLTTTDVSTTATVPTPGVLAAPSARGVADTGQHVVVGLITPYCGGNLGDAAIYESSIRAIMDRAANAEVFGATLYPSETTALHGVRSIPINGYSTPKYNVITSESSEAEGSSAGDDAVAQPTTSAARGAVKAVLRVFPPLFRALRATRDLAVRVRGEIAHVRLAYALAKKSDLIAINGGGQLDDEFGGAWAHPYVLLKWSLVARAAGTPFVVLSVGVCRLTTRLACRFMRIALGNAAYRSFRDVKSRDTASARLGAETDDRVVPDLAFGLQVDHQARTTTPRDRLTIGISPIAHRDPRWWGKSDAQGYKRYVQALADFATSVAREGHELRWYTTARPDRAVLLDVLAALPDDVRATCPTARPTITLQEALQQIRECDLVVASRLHGVILSHVMRRPVLALSYDDKVTTHMREMRMVSHCVDINSADYQSIRTGFDRLLSEADELRATLNDVVPRNRDAVLAQMTQVLTLAS